MSAHVLLNLLWEACRAFYIFFATSLMNSIIQEHECLSYDINISLKSHFCSKKCYNFVIMYKTLVWTS